KRDMYFLARRYGIPTADTSFPACRSDVVEFIRTAQFPVMLKASDNIAVSRRAGKKMIIARSPEDLLAHYDAMEDPSNPTMMLQEYIPGGDDSVWMFNGYFDERSRCLFGITGKKIHQTPVYTGMTAIGVCVPNPAVHDQTQRLVEATGYKGILDIGYRYDFRDGSYKLLDSNPRLGATFRLFVGSGELDVVRAAYLDLTGQRVPDSRIIAGRKWLLEDADIVSSWNYFRDGTVTPRDWMRSYSGIRETAWFAADDLRPFLYVFGRSWTTLGRRVSRLVRSERANAPAIQNGCRCADRQRQAAVNTYFQSSARYWKEIYHGHTLQPLIYQQRRDTALLWIERLRLPRRARILEVGCGAGLLAVELASAGHFVDAFDPAPAMVDMTRRQANDRGVAARVRVSAGDVHALNFRDGCFDLVVALGVVPWLHSEAKALAEMQRVLKPEGYLLITADNALRLDAILDPISTPALRPLRRMYKALIGAARSAKRDDHLPKRHRPFEIENLLAGERLVKIRSQTLGFGPFTFCGYEIFGETMSIRIDRRLRALGERSFPGLKKTGAQYLILARKRGVIRTSGERVH